MGGIDLDLMNSFSTSSSPDKYFSKEVLNRILTQLSNRREKDAIFSELFKERWDCSVSGDITVCTLKQEYYDKVRESVAIACMAKRAGDESLKLAVGGDSKKFIKSWTEINSYVESFPNAL